MLAAPTAPPAAPPAATPPPADKPTTPSTPPPNERPPEDWLGGIESDLTELDATPAAQPDSRDAKGKFVAAKGKQPETPPETPPVEKPPETPPESAGEKPPETPPEAGVKPVKAAELRTAYEGLKKRVKEELEPEVQKLRAKVADYEAKGSVDPAPLLEKVKALEARNSALEKHIEYVDYAQSEKFNSEHARPYQEAWENAVSTFRQLTVREKTGPDDMDVTTRPADENDLLKLANMKLSEIDAAAQEMFGPSAARAILHVEKIKDLSAKQHRALQEARQKASEWRSQRTAEFQGKAKLIGDTWAETNKILAEKFPKAFNVEEGNAEDAASHSKGFALADLMFLGEQALKPDQIEALPANFRDTIKSKKPLSEIQKVQLHALARLKMANHDRRVAALKKANARIAELEKQLGEYEGSAPPAGKAGKGERTPASKDWEQQISDEINALDK